jgi:hypothetical protein
MNCFLKKEEVEYEFTNIEKEIIKQLKKIYGNKYDYSNVRYSKYGKLRLICKTHGEFTRSYNSLFSGSSCNTCDRQKELDRVYNYYIKY